MIVSALNCTPIKPQTSFGQREGSGDGYKDLLDVTSQLNDEFVQAKDVKKPVAALASIGLAGLLAFASGKKIASIITTVGKDLPLKAETALKSGSKSVQKVADSLVNDAPTKLGKAKNVAGSILKKGESVARSAYKKIAYSGIGEDCINPDRATKAFQNVAGWLGVATVFPTVCTRDTNKDGVADILQKSQNAYTGTQTKMAKAIEDTTRFADVADLITSLV